MLVRMPTKSAKQSKQLRTPGAAQAIAKVKSGLRYRTPEKCQLLRYIVLERGAAAALLRALGGTTRRQCFARSRKRLFEITRLKCSTAQP